MKKIAVTTCFAIGIIAVGFAQPRPAGQGQPPQGGMRMGGGSGTTGLIRRSDVQKELALTAAQKTKIEAALKTTRPKEGEKFDRAKMEAAMKKAEATINATLTAAQKSRLKQLSYQRMGVAGVMMPEVATALGLTSTQKTKITGIYQAEMKKVIGTPKPGERPQFDRAKMEAAMKRIETQVNAALTATQKSKWTAMKGKPFKFENIGPQRRSGGI